MKGGTGIALSSRSFRVDGVTAALWVAAVDLALWLAIVEAARLVVT